MGNLSTKDFLRTSSALKGNKIMEKCRGVESITSNVMNIETVSRCWNIEDRRKSDIVLPLNQLFAQYNFGALNFDQFLIVIMDDSLLQLLLLLLCHRDWVRRRGVGLIVQWAELVGPHVSDGTTCSTL